MSGATTASGTGWDLPTGQDVLEVEDFARSVDEMVEAVRRGKTTAREGVDGISGVTTSFLRYCIDADEAELAFGFARESVRCLSLQRDVMDPVLVDYFDQWVAGAQAAEGLSARLDLVLDPIELAIAHGDDAAMTVLHDLCRHGHRSHPMLFRLRSAPGRVLRLAYRVGCVPGIRDAVSPRYEQDGQIANAGTDPNAFGLALNMLGHYAADPWRGATARAALLELAGHWSTAGEAVIRLPLHLLTDDDRQQLLQVHEDRAAFFADVPAERMFSLGVLRDNRIVRAAVWQAFDARHVA